MVQTSIGQTTRERRRPRRREDVHARFRDDVARGSHDGQLASLWSEAEAGTKSRPLVVDLDGTLIRSDLLVEAACSELGRRPHSLFEMLSVLREGKAALKDRLSEPFAFDPAMLPYDGEVLSRIEQARAEGRSVYLASASNWRLVQAVANHLGLFEGWFASDQSTNLSGEAKASVLVEQFGDRGFDYIGNDAADLPVWSRAAKALAIRAPAHVARRLAGEALDVEHLESPRVTIRTWAKLLRVHQYAKNALVFLPLLTAHVFAVESFVQAFLAAIAFSLCASSVYLVNDLLDLQDDRTHRSKRHRPLACGAIPLMHGIMAAPLLLAAALALAAFVSGPFLSVLVGYFGLTTAYSFLLKRKMLIDVITLALLYSIRVIGGAVAVEVSVSPWLLAFCLSMFMSLALIKRYVELAGRLDAKLPDTKTRDYRVSDIDMVGALAAAAGFNAVTVFMLYISSDSVQQLYSRPEILWLVAPVLMFWIGRALMLANRRLMDDDPVVFALKDRVSLGTLALSAVLVVAAT